MNESVLEQAQEQAKVETDGFEFRKDVMLLQVHLVDIDQGVCGIPWRCALALALQRATGAWRVRVGTRSCRWTISDEAGDDVTWFGILGEDARRFVRHFDGIKYGGRGPLPSIVTITNVSHT